MNQPAYCAMCGASSLRPKPWGYWCEVCGHEHYTDRPEGESSWFPSTMPAEEGR